MQPVEIRIAALIFLIVVWVMIIGAATDFFAVENADIACRAIG